MSKAALLSGPSRALVIIYNGPNQFLLVHRIYYFLYTLKIKKFLLSYNNKYISAVLTL